MSDGVVLNCQGIEVRLQPRALRHFRHGDWGLLQQALESSDFFVINSEYLSQRGTRAGQKLNITLGKQAVNMDMEVVHDDQTGEIMIIHLNPDGYPWG